MPADAATIELARLLRIGIGDGECDDELLALREAIDSRLAAMRAMLSADVLRVLRIGDGVRVIRLHQLGERPSKWDNARGIVEKVGSRGEVTIDLDRGRGKLRCQASNLHIEFPASRGS